MDILLDTHTFVWYFNGDKNLSEKAKEAIESDDNLKLISIASIWEIGVKISLGKFNFQDGFNKLLEMINENGFEILPVTNHHAIAVSSLEFIHRDPFDRMLIAQSMVENLAIVTKDENIHKYKINTIW